MKINEKKIILVLILMFLVYFFTTFFFNIFTYVNLEYILFWIITLILLCFLVGHRIDKYPYKIDSIQIIIIYTFTYLILLFLSGLFLGYIKSPYNLNILKIIKNIIPFIIIIFTQELFRYNILKKSNNKFIIILLFTIFVCFEISLNIKFYDLSSPTDIFDFISNLIVLSIIKNIFFMYISKRSTYKIPLIYRLILELYIYVVPIVPDIDIYFSSVLNILFLTILFLRFNRMFERNKPITNCKNKFINSIFLIPLISIFIMVVLLVSNKFKVSALAIGSDSMNPVIYNGDVVIIEKDYEYKSYKINDILVFNKDNKIIVHRIKSINIFNKKYVFKTKGDNNREEDTFNVEESEIIGKVNLTIPYIGYPSAWLTEYFKVR